MSYKRNRYAPYRRIVRSQLSMIDIRDQNSFDRWLDTVKTSKNSQQTDLPSSRLPPVVSQINPNVEQLFVVIDTCSIVNRTHEFMDFVTNLKRLFRNTYCPIKFIICLTVLEELDKCNRPIKKRGNTNHRQQDQNLSKQQVDSKPFQPKEQNLDNDQPPIEDLLQTNSPPRLFMRFIEEEMRIGNILIGELDPYKVIKLSKLDAVFEIVNKDDRILECCIRSWAFIRMNPCNPNTKLILVSEDNIFKAKASTFGVPSFRWREFEAKYRNFGLKNCVPTPVCPNVNNNLAPTSSYGLTNNTVSMVKSKSIKTSLVRKILRAGVGKISDNQIPQESLSEDIAIVKEVINIQ